jgi:hypothetical protein
MCIRVDLEMIEVLQVRASRCSHHIWFTNLWKIVQGDNNTAKRHRFCPYQARRCLDLGHCYPPSLIGHLTLKNLNYLVHIFDVTLVLSIC